MKKPNRFALHTTQIQARYHIPTALLNGLHKQQEWTARLHNALYGLLDVKAVNTCQVARFDGGILVIQVAHTTLANYLNSIYPQLFHACQHTFCPLHSIQIIVNC